jgi:predicted nucleic acid-binding protein
MNASCFIDTNVLVYAASSRGEESWKRLRAFEILEDAEFATSAQVLQEFFVTVTRKMKHPMTAEDALGWIERIAEQPVVAVDVDVVMRAAAISSRFEISYWDAAIIAAAENVNAKTLYTEDLNHQQLYGSVTVINPFTNN